MAVEIDLVRNAEEWNDFVQTSGNATIFHEWDWLRIAEEFSKSKLYPLAGYKGSEPVVIMPVFVRRSGGFRLAFSPPPHLAIPYMGPLVLNDTTLKTSIIEYNYRYFVRAFDEFVSNEINADYTRITTPPGIIDVRPFKWRKYESEPFYSYIINLKRSNDEIWMSLEKKLRQNVKKAGKLNFEIYRGGLKELMKVIDLVNSRYAEQNREPDVDPDYLKSIYGTFEDKVRVYVVEYESEIVTGIVDLAYRKTASSWIGNPKVTVSGTYPNDLLNWHVIRDSLNEGFEYYEIIGANTERLTEFKTRYNPGLNIYFMVTKAGVTARMAERFYRIFKSGLK